MKTPKLNPIVLEAAAEAAFTRHLIGMAPHRRREAETLWRESSQARTLWTEIVGDALAMGAALHRNGLLFEPDAGRTAEPGHALALHTLEPGKTVAGPVSAILARIRAQQQGQPEPETAPDFSRAEVREAARADLMRAAVEDVPKGNTREFRNFGDLGEPAKLGDNPPEIFADDPRPNPDTHPTEYRRWKTRNFGRIYGAPYKGDKEPG